ncbi:putative membrane protein YdjX (TVP38/TMEM64 family) [Brevibacillus aydinogluensis]|jgi:hypothetical protein|nr:putative membrane protein YdjX (TVP38/TMEM64 family) [Brevibacillus aydinogluensis]
MWPHVFSSSLTHGKDRKECTDVSIYPFIIAVLVLSFIGLVSTILIGRNPEEKTRRSFARRSKNLLSIYLSLTLVLLIAFFIFLSRQ